MITEEQTKVIIVLLTKLMMSKVKPQLPPEAKAQWIEDWEKRMTFEEICEGIERFKWSDDDFPTMGKIYNIMQPSDSELALAANERFLYLQNLRKKGRPCDANNFDEKAVQAIGGWEKLRTHEKTEKFIDIARCEFVKMYASMMKASDISRKQIEDKRG